MKQILTLQRLMEVLNKKYPPHLAEEWDRVGLHMGRKDRPVHRILTTLDVRPNVVQEAIENNIDTILVHHPMIFHPIPYFDFDHPIHAMYEQLIKHDINVFAMHTNVDAAYDGMNDWLAAAIGLENVSPLKVIDDKPTMMRTGHFPTPLTKQEVIDRLKSEYQLSHLTWIEKQERDQYQKVAIVGGGGGSMLQEAIEQAEVDIYITGDITFHTAQDAYESHLALVDVGHGVERIFNERIAQMVNTWAKEYQWEVSAISSQLTTDPLEII